jgi:REP element-mobilizing transposase RayT
MPRTARSIEAGTVYHVLNRGNDRMRLFHKDVDYDAYERVLIEGFSRYPVELLTYCLMPNHWHLVVRPKTDEALGRLMGWVGVTHVRRHHEHDHQRGTGGVGKVGLIVDRSARAAILSGWCCPSCRCQQQVSRCQQVSLGRHPCKGRCPLVRLIDVLLAGGALPEQPARLRIKAIQEAVVIGRVESAVGHSRREAEGAPGGESPLDAAVLETGRPERIVNRRPR